MNRALKADLEAWRTRSLADLDVLGLYLDALVLRVCSAGKVVGVPVLGVIAVLTDGQKQLLALDRGWKSRPVNAVAGRPEPSLASVAATRGGDRGRVGCGQSAPTG